MLNSKMEAALNEQLQEETFSAYLYLAMSAYCESANWKGIANWLKVQQAEEALHADKIFRFILDRGGRVDLKAIQAPGNQFGSSLALFEQVLKHEQHITNCIHKLYEAAITEKDYAAQAFLNWFITEQVEEEANVTGIIDLLKSAGDNKGALFFIDKELGARTLAINSGTGANGQ